MTSKTKGEFVSQLVNHNVSVDPDDVRCIVGDGSETQFFMKDGGKISVKHRITATLLKAHADYLDETKSKKRQRESDIELQDDVLTVWVPHSLAKCRKVELVFNNE